MNLKSWDFDKENCKILSLQLQYCELNIFDYIMIFLESCELIEIISKIILVRYERKMKIEFRDQISRVKKIFFFKNFDFN